MDLIDIVWGILLAGGVALLIIQGRPEQATVGVIHAAEGAVALVIGLVGTIALWTGLMRVAEEAGLDRVVSRLLRPVLTRLFPTVPKDHPALGAVAMSVSANLLGLGNASTPLGIKAMQELQTLNPDKDAPSQAQCTYLALVMSGLTLVPATVIALRARFNSAAPAATLGPTLCATLVGTAAALLVDWSFNRNKHSGRRAKRGRS